ncbi:MerR family transcriptional regulator [Actinacidiphila glaucinigra]|uniref:MerR family transcriptional regulator n=1 Tax=Actinacidiphila glaucinigra TaxID=235986 RepID=UPI0036EDF743
MDDRQGEGDVKIGELAAKTGVAPRLLRYYEEVGILTPFRSPNGYRMYGEPAIERVHQIRELKRCQALVLRECHRAAAIEMPKNSVAACLANPKPSSATAKQAKPNAPKPDRTAAIHARRCASRTAIPRHPEAKRTRTTEPVR